MRVRAASRVWRKDPFFAPRSTNTAFARAAWAISARSEGSGIANVTKICRRGAVSVAARAKLACASCNWRASCSRSRGAVGPVPSSCGVEGIAMRSSSASVGMRCSRAARSISAVVGGRTEIVAGTPALLAGVCACTRSTVHTNTAHASSAISPPMARGLEGAGTAVPLAKQQKAKSSPRTGYSLPAPQSVVVRPKGWQQRPSSFSVLGIG